MPQEREVVRRHNIRSRLINTASQLFLAVLSLALFAVVIVFVQATYVAESRSQQKLPLDVFLKMDISKTLAIVRVAQGLLSTITGIAISNSFVFMHWIMMAGDGLLFPKFLALSPMTAPLGTLALLKSSDATLSARLWALLRLIITIISWLPGLLLFVNTSIVTVYDTAYTYNVSAGVGPFNESLVQPFIDRLQSSAPDYPYQVLPYSYFASVYILVLNPVISTTLPPSQCRDPGCTSYLLSGGVEMTAPWIPQGYPDHTMIKVDRVPSVQLDFKASVDSKFEESDCDLFGAPGYAIGIKLCLEASSNPSSLRAGLFVCQNGTYPPSACQASDSLPNITTTASFSTLLADVVASRYNFTIVNTANHSGLSPFIDLSLPAYRASLRWLLNNSDAAAIPPPSSIGQSFWSSPDQLRNPSTQGMLTQNFQSILAFPFWLFNANNWANPLLVQNRSVQGAAPPQFYTLASVVEPHVKIRFDGGIFVAFVALQSAAVLFVWATLVWVWCGTKEMLASTSFPVFDMTCRVGVTGVNASCRSLRKVSDAEVLSMVKRANASVKLD
ncbi:hypothetical protein GQ53DRAFT_648717 [Thozetella sp. PMI_491]|nr:hypothetical protein GQ53DRAFT_648717 [Thozetella sp. PMI_491]